MPIINVDMLEGRDDATRERLIAEITDAAVRALGAPRETVRVILHEVPKQNFGIGGISAKALGR